MSPLFAWNDVVLCDDLGQLLSKWQQSWSSVPNNKRTTSFQELKSMYIRVKVLLHGGAIERCASAKFRSAKSFMRRSWWVDERQKKQQISEASDEEGGLSFS